MRREPRGESWRSLCRERERERDLPAAFFVEDSGAERMDGAGVVMPAGVGKAGDICLELWIEDVVVNVCENRQASAKIILGRIQRSPGTAEDSPAARWLMIDDQNIMLTRA